MGGKWIKYLDIIRKVGEAPELGLQLQTELGECRQECSTIQGVCKKVLKSKDEAIVKLLADRAGAGTLQREVCAKACETRDKFPDLAKWSNEEFKEDSDAKMNSLMESMKGMPGMENMKMYKPGDFGPGMAEL